MKRILSLFLLSLGGCGLLQAEHQIPVSKEKLPLESQQFIEQNFPDAQITRTVQEKEALRRNYTVWLDNGIILEFEKEGKWKEIHSNGYAPIPFTLIPERIRTYVADNYPARTIVEIERARNSQLQVELDNGTEILFNRFYKVVEIDD